ncbi:MAG: phospho-N-acetylmuramoyl-pentapeptide-transferase [Candidatus Neomarinimicrobiota bacterium]
MLYHLLYPLKSYVSGLNIFQYITFRATSAAILALLMSFLIGPVIIRLLERYQIGEEIRTSGPQSHQRKKGTPTMGGIIILSAVILPTLLFARLDNAYVLMILLAVVWMGVIGFIDDYLKTIKKTKSGLVARYKLAGQVSLGLIISLWVFLSPQFQDIRSVTSIPFFKNLELDFGYFYPVIIILIITYFSNSVNLTDGLDGLAAGLSAIAFSVFAGVAYLSGRVDFSDYLNIIYLPGAGELTIFAAAMAGACLGYLWFNAAPAQIFMGDTGSLATGAALGTLAVLLKKELLLLIIGGVFVWEGVSVMLQVGYYQWTKKRTGTGVRIFKMAPVHHHYELSGWPETKVVIRFWIIGILLALFSFSTFKIR